MTDAERRLADENETLRLRLEEAEATIDAIRHGHVDALVVATPGEGSRVFTLTGAEQPYRLLVEAMQQGAVTLDEAGTVLYCNASFAAMLERPPETVIGASFPTFLPESDRMSLKGALRDARTAGRQWETRLRRDGGALLPVAVAAGPLPLDAVPAVSLIVTDLTGQRQYRELQEADRRKDEFLAMLAHELRNPLAPIANASQVLCLTNAGASDEVAWACQVIDRQVQQMTYIVDDLLDVSRITRGKITLHPKPLEVSAIVARAVETSRPLIESRRHELSVTLPADGLSVRGDETRLAQVLTNLLNNAAKYTEEGGRLRLGVEREGSDVLIKVRDNGVGLSPEMLTRVFDLFIQADRSIDRSQGGLGIGLTLVKSLVEMHGGGVSASSDGPGRGSEFVVRLPLLVAVPAAAGAAETAAPAAASVSRRVLVVDDNRDSATTMALLLKSTGHETRTCFDGPSAVEAAVTFRPAVVLLDIGLPDMNGYAVAASLRGRPETRDAVLVAMTGYGSDEDRARSREAGFDHHFVKPVGYQELMRLLNSLGKAGRPAAPA